MHMTNAELLVSTFSLDVADREVICRNTAAESAGYSQYTNGTYLPSGAE